MAFQKGESGNPKGSIPGKKRAGRGSGLLRSAARYALKHMDEEPGSEPRAPSGAAKVMLREARENPSKFLDRVERILHKPKSETTADIPEITPHDQPYGEVIDRLLKEFENGQSGTMGGGSSAGSNGKPQIPAVCAG